MVKKVAKKKEKTSRADAKKLSLAELYTLYQVAERFYQQPVRGPAAKGIITSRYMEVRNELFQRVYGCDPYSVEAESYTLRGVDPKNVDLQKVRNKSAAMVESAKASGNFVVAKNKTEQKGK